MDFFSSSASERVEEARARYRIAGAAQYPFVYADEQAEAARIHHRLRQAARDHDVVAIKQTLHRDISTTARSSAR